MKDWRPATPRIEPTACCGQIAHPMRDGGARCVECGKRFAPDSGPLPDDDGVYAVPERFEAQKQTEAWSLPWIITAAASLMALVFVWTDCGVGGNLVASAIIVLLAADRHMLEDEIDVGQR